MTIKKMSMILLLGLSISNQLVAMNAENESRKVNQLIGELLAVAQNMNNAFLNALQEQANEFDSSSENPDEIKRVFDAAHNAEHQYMTDYENVVNKFPTAQKDYIIRMLKNRRGDTSNIKSVGAMVDALKRDSDNRLEAFGQIVRAVTIPSKAEIESQFVPPCDDYGLYLEELSLY